jgi:hypothetical protein
MRDLAVCLSVLTGTNIVENNIFYASTVTGSLVQAQTTSNVTLNYNLYYAPSSTENWCWGYNANIGDCTHAYTTFSSYQSGAKQDMNSQFANPDFVQHHCDAAWHLAQFGCDVQFASAGERNPSQSDFGSRAL